MSHIEFVTSLLAYEKSSPIEGRGVWPMIVRRCYDGYTCQFLGFAALVNISRYCEFFCPELSIAADNGAIPG